MNRHWTIPAFADLKQDIEFFVRANAMRRFLLNRKTARHGWVLNVRATTSLDNMLSQIYQLKGRPTGKNINPIGPIGIKSSCVGARWMRWEADAVYNDHWSKKPVKRRDVMHLSSLFEHNVSYQLNAKTAAFIKELETRDRFTQHCIIRNKPWTEDEYNEWVDVIMCNRDWEDSMSALEREYIDEMI